MIDIGICSSIRDIDAVQKSGADYVELPLRDVMALSQAEFDQLHERLTALSLPVRAMNCFTINERKLLGPRQEIQTLTAYTIQAAERAKALGTKVLVLGSGGARRYEPDYPLRRAVADFCAFLRMANDVLSHDGILLGLEPLHHTETNFLYRVSEADYLAASLALPQIRVLADTYHMEKENEPLSVISESGDLLCHVHVANPKGRIYPKENDGTDYVDLMRRLKLIGFAGGVSIEASTSDFVTDAPTAIHTLRQAYALA